MNPGLLLIGLVLVVLQLTLPLRWAFLPMLLAACHTPAVQLLGDFTVTRTVIIIGLMRAMTCGQFRWSTSNPLDVLVAIWAGVALFSFVGHSGGTHNPLIFRCGLVLNVVGAYLYTRAYLHSDESLELFSMGLMITIVPFALLMALEQATGKNPYSFVGARLTESLVREGTVRATGPFGTPILSGTMGAATIPFMVILRQYSKRMGNIGIIAALVIVISSGSSGPIATTGIACIAMFCWRFRHYGRLIIWGGIGAVMFMQLFRERPIWYLMAVMDFVGGSTGWHRAKLIDSAYENLGEWWLLGTDYTRDWMPYGLPMVPEHCDLTNYYIHLGVIGGLPLMFCLIAVLWKSVRMLITEISESMDDESPRGFMLWCVTSAIIAHAITFLSISYFDQIYVFFWVLIGALPAFLTAWQENDEVEEIEGEEDPDPLAHAQFG
ncbi:MAG: hypothetical protein AAGI48_02385 [Verrucomicrobiota bacterium]